MECKAEGRRQEEEEREEEGGRGEGEREKQTRVAQDNVLREKYVRGPRPRFNLSSTERVQKKA